MDHGGKLMAWIISLLASWGLGEGRAKALAPWVALAAAIALLAALWMLSAPMRAIFDHFDDRRAVAEDRRANNLEQLEQQREADTAAAEQRVEDALAQQEQEQAYDDAINRPHAGDSASPRVRLACERLRRAGQDTAAIPACGGR